jgi:hypothetical protein
MGIESFIRKMCVQTAVYWGNPQPDGYGKMTYDDPREIFVRWDVKRIVVIGPDAKEINSDVEILTPEDLELQGVLILGTLEALFNSSSGSDEDPWAVGEAYEILALEKISMPKSLTQYVRKAYLSKYKV